MQTLIFLQVAGGNAGMIQMLLFAAIAAIILIFWLFIIRPQAKLQKEQNLLTAWYHNWGTFMFTVAIAVAIGTLAAAYIFYLVLSDKLGNPF